MREHSVPAAYEVPAAGNLTDLIYDNAKSDPAHAAFARKIDDDWVDVTSAEFIAEVEEVAKGLVASGVEPGDRVAIMPRTRRFRHLVCRRCRRTDLRDVIDRADTLDPRRLRSRRVLCRARRP